MDLRTSIKDWFHAFRLRTLPLSLSCIIMGSFIHYKEHFSWLIFSLAVATTLFLQVLSNLANDYGDFKKGTDNNDRIGPERSLQSGRISESQMKVAVIICTLLALGTGILLLGYTFKWVISIESIALFCIGILSVVTAIKYTVGKFALAYHALGDLFVFLFFGVVGVLGSSFLFTHEIKTEDFYIASTIGLWSAAVLNMNNMRDHLNDKAQNKNTLVVLIGFSKAKIYHTFLILGGLFSSLVYFTISNQWTSLFACLIGIILLNSLVNVWKTIDPKELDPELKKIAISTFGFSVFYALITSLYV